jgi:hypothetical protein
MTITINPLFPEESTNVPMTFDLKPDANKPRFSLLPWRAITEVAKLMTESAATHGATDYLTRPNGRARYTESLGRHLAAIFRGEDYDESTHLHLAHAAADALIALELALMEEAQK